MPTSLQLQRINTTAAAATASSSSSTTPSATATSAMTNYLQIVHPSVSVPDDAVHYHTHAVGPDQSCSAVSQAVSAPVSTVWSVVRRFDNPQVYKNFVKSCQVIVGDGNVGTLREVHVVSGLPAASSTERLEILDDERHIISFSIVGGEHRLNNYRSVTTLHQSPAGAGTVVIESYVVDVPPGNTKEETCVFVDTIVRCNLQSLARIAEDLAKTNNCKSS
ncbi:abscisic acid receptor PYL4 [Rhododendron vialii]|uniref:abscisic acid receptor PYL4 n=1 Tax=Rhododendron vialii TaxID=182163 RepID=UPI00265DE908|nr:abscisic acid receptor PYL4 [Rhododendron vialii]